MGWGWKGTQKMRDEPEKLDLHGAIWGRGRGTPPWCNQGMILKIRTILWILKLLTAKHVMQIPCFDTPISSWVEFALLIRTFYMNGCLLRNSMRSSILHLYECRTNTACKRHTSGKEAHIWAAHSSTHSSRLLINQNLLKLLPWTSHHVNKH